MSREKDLTYIDGRIEELKASMKSVVDAYNAFAEQTKSAIVDALKEAGVFDQVHELEVELQQVAKEAQDKLAVLNREVASFERAKEVLLAIPAEDPVIEKPSVSASEAEGDPEEVEPEPVIADEPTPEPHPPAVPAKKVSKPARPSFR